MSGVMADEALKPSSPNQATADLLAHGETRYRAGAYAHAAAIFARLRDAHPNDPNALRLLGLSRLRLGETDAALALLAQAHALAPSDPYAQMHYGLGLHAAGRHAEAAAQFRASAQRLPDD